MQTGDNIKAQNANWKFDEAVAQNFDEHAEKSIPLYNIGHDLIVKLSDFFLQDGSICYDIGCSTGSLLQKLAIHNAHKNVRFIGIDNQKAMLTKAQKKCKNFKNIEFIHGNIEDMDLEKADLIVSYYTMQFIRPKYRQILFDKFFKALNWSGALLLFEKVRANDARFQDMMTALYTDYKLDQNYKAEEIMNKTKSLKGVLDPFSTQANLDYLQRAGFADYINIMKYVCFEGFLAIK
ncbi:methyltransferase domain-containing protein [bacterium]|nr:methyltransferase domain-containing protein [bacterium]MBT4552720.1 methyltransferase domain-containing protein [bacterium]MBT7087445.1 methyltransferase domain-containing protein [bacterium]